MSDRAERHVVVPDLEDRVRKMAMELPPSDLASTRSIQHITSFVRSLLSAAPPVQMEAVAWRGKRGDYPVGTQAFHFNGGHWTRTEQGWQWNGGDTFPQPGPDAFEVEIPVAYERLAKRPALFRVQRAKGVFDYYMVEEQAQQHADALGVGYDGLYLRDGAPLYASPVPSSERSALLKCEEALRAAKQLCDNINEFGHVTDQEYHDAAEAQISSALSLFSMRLAMGNDDLDVTASAHGASLAAAGKRREVEPVAWRVGVPNNEYATLREDVAEIARKHGYEVTPLFASLVPSSERDVPSDPLGRPTYDDLIAALAQCREAIPDDPDDDVERTSAIAYPLFVPDLVKKFVARSEAERDEQPKPSVFIPSNEILVSRDDIIEMCAKVAEESVRQKCCGRGRVVCDGNGEPIGEDCCGEPDLEPMYPNEIASSIRSLKSQPAQEAE